MIANHSVAIRVIESDDPRRDEDGPSQDGRYEGYADEGNRVRYVIFE